MKIIYLHQYFNTPDMAGGTRSYEMARRLVAAGHDVHMVTSWRSEDDEKKGWFTTSEAGISVHWLPVPYSNHMSYYRRLQAFARFAILSCGKAIELGGDVVFATSTPLSIAIPGVVASRRNKIPMIFEVRDLWPELPIAVGALRNPFTKWFARKLEKWAYKHSEAFVALSPGMKDGIVKAGVASQRVAVIPNSSDNDDFIYCPQLAAKFRADREWLQGRPLLVYTGTFGAINGVGFMVELAEELIKINPEIKILLIGDGQEKSFVRSLAREKGVLNVNLFIEEVLPKKEVPSVLGAADMAASLFVDLPEMQANSANKFFDALASGTPLLLNYGGWQHDLLLSKGCGLAMWKQPLNLIAKEVAEKITDPSWLERAGRASRLLAVSDFDRDLLADQLQKVILSGSRYAGTQAEKIAPGTYK